MSANSSHLGTREQCRFAMAPSTLLLALIATFSSYQAVAYVGDSFLQIPSVVGYWHGRQHRNWVRIDANYWKADEGGMFGSDRVRKTFRRSRTLFSGPSAPRQGPSSLMISLDKHDPALAQLTQLCLNKTLIPEVDYAESSVEARSLRELGPRPAQIPEYFEYQLHDVVISGCPAVSDAAEQAFVLTFSDIKWLNYHGQGDGEPIQLEPSTIKPAQLSAKTRDFVVTWFAVAHDVGEDQCEQMNSKPTQDDYYALMSKQDADEARTENEKNGGVAYDGGQMELRGPDKLNACLLPGITPDRGLFSPRTTARGFNLDRNDGAHNPAAGTCKHRNFMSADGRAGIDNQLYSVQGCMAGYQGHKGFLMQYTNEQRRNGLLSILVEVSGIDNEQNDNSVDVSVFYSLDHMAKDASGKQILSDYTFRVTDKLEYTHYFTRLHARIVNGIILTDPVKQLQFNPGLDPELTLTDAQMRLQILPDGTLKGVVGGYQDWRKVMRINANSNAESLYGFQCPAMYGALKRAADGLKNPDTGECDGISSAYDIEGVSAFILSPQIMATAKPREQPQLAQTDSHNK